MLTIYQGFDGFVKLCMGNCYDIDAVNTDAINPDSLAGLISKYYERRYKIEQKALATPRRLFFTTIYPHIFLMDCVCAYHRSPFFCVALLIRFTYY